MLNTFDALAAFSDNNDAEKNNDTPNSGAENNATVDLSAIINRLNDMETKINQMLNKSTDFPTRGKPDENAAIGDGGSENNNSGETEGE